MSSHRPPNASSWPPDGSDVAPQDTPNDWQGGPLQALPHVAALARDLTAAGLDAGRAGVLRDGADRAVAAWEGIAGRLPTQVVHAS
jgi:homoserine kinase type II